MVVKRKESVPWTVEEVEEMGTGQHAFYSCYRLIGHSRNRNTGGATFPRFCLHISFFYTKSFIDTINSYNTTRYIEISIYACVCMYTKSTSGQLSDALMAAFSIETFFVSPGAPSPDAILISSTIIFIIN